MIRTVIDWESAYGTHADTGTIYSLTRLTNEEYIRDPRFKAHGLGVKIDKDPAFYVHGAELIDFLKTHPWDKSFVIAHHSHFDGAILSWRAGIIPAFWGDTLSMGRAIFPHESASLANLSKVLGIGEKGKELMHFSGKWSLTKKEQAILGAYCCNDVELTSEIFDTLKPHFPVSELRLIDWTVRCFTEPVIQVDPRPLVEAYKSERRNKRRLIKACVTDKKTLASADKFAELLLTLGVDPPKKVSPSKVKDGRVDPDAVGDPPQGRLPSFKVSGDKETRERIKQEKNAYPWAYAFGKSDEGFKMLQDHPDPNVRAVIEARLGVKSTIKETRTKRFYKIGKRGAFPVYLNYYGAHTNRWSGGDRQNAQNLNRVDYRDPTAGALRFSWIAPRDHLILVRDQAQIEARMLAYWAGQDDVVDVFRQGGDPYNYMASKVYGFEVDRKNNPEHKAPGMVGKIIVLGCGYQMGAWKLQENIRVGFMGMPGFLFGREYVGQLDVDVEAFKWQKSYKKGFTYAFEQAEACRPLNVSVENHIMHCAITKFLVDTFRRSNSRVKALWSDCQRALQSILLGERTPVGVSDLVYTDPEGLVLPHGMKIRYNKLRCSGKREFTYLVNVRKKEWTKLYGGKMAENGTQALSRLVLSDQLLRIKNKMTGYTLKKGEHLKIASSTHDELIAVAPQRIATEVMQMMKHEMSVPPAWCPDMPLKSSGGHAATYGDCEK